MKKDLTGKRKSPEKGGTAGEREKGLRRGRREIKSRNTIERWTKGFYNRG